MFHSQCFCTSLIKKRRKKKEGCKHASEKDKCNLIRLLWDSALYGMHFCKAREDTEDEQNIGARQSVSVKMSLKLSEDNICRQTLWNDVYFRWWDCWCLRRKNVRVLFCVILWSRSVSTLRLHWPFEFSLKMIMTFFEVHWASFKRRRKHWLKASSFCMHAPYGKQNCLKCKYAFICSPRMCLNDYSKTILGYNLELSVHL